MCEAIHANPGYRGITAPRTLRHRYIFEDVPYSLVPISELGKRFGVDVWGMESMIQIACVIDGVDYRHRGRTLERMGLVGLSLQDHAAGGDGQPRPGATPSQRSIRAP